MQGLGPACKNGWTRIPEPVVVLVLRGTVRHVNHVNDDLVPYHPNAVTQWRT